jgi:hypothetical protein
MHHTLLIPEIVANIVRCGIPSPGFLHTCLFINKLFSIEAIRILWEGCGAWSKSAIDSPTIQHLAHIVALDLQRGQFYANFIHKLSFRVEVTNHGSLDEARWHTELASLQFPSLQVVDFHESTNATSLNTGHMITHYAQPNVKAFSLHEGSQLSDDFLEKLSRLNLLSLTLDNISENKISEHGFIQFLKNSSSLKTLEVRNGLEDIWSYSLFEAVAKYHKLEFLSIPDIQDEWLSSPSYSPLPNLEYLFTGISDQGLETLAQYTPNLKIISLSLQNLSPSHQVVRSAAQYSQLTQILIEFGWQSSVSGNDLILLTQSCPALTGLSIGEIGGVRPASDMTDNTIDKMAQSMKNISTLSLVINCEYRLSWKSLLSLSQYCKTLNILELFGNINWREVIDGIKPNSFLMLSRLTLFSDQTNSLTDSLDDNDEDLKIMAPRFLALTPKLTNFAILGGNDTDQFLRRAIYDILQSRA